MSGRHRFGVRDKIEGDTSEGAKAGMATGRCAGWLRRTGPHDSPGQRAPAGSAGRVWARAPPPAGQVNPGEKGQELLLVLMIQG
jgi:hypothetical protein